MLLLEPHLGTTTHAYKHHNVGAIWAWLAAVVAAGQLYWQQHDHGQQLLSVLTGILQTPVLTLQPALITPYCFDFRGPARIGNDVQVLQWYRRWRTRSR
jgi:hypothetical protein